ncbi:hypothetical protein [Lactococcus nasutitermitis]|uniref:hypothetical protein n=1 Tax=Lactococcus nasutitermitis TaxID=1652957 RepID=UPI0036D23041
MTNVREIRNNGQISLKKMASFSNTIIMIGEWLLFKRQHKRNKMNAPKKDMPEEEKTFYIKSQEKSNF